MSDESRVTRSLSPPLATHVDVMEAKLVLDGRRVSLLRSGDHGPGVMLLHGIPTGSELWRRVMERMSGVRAVAPDLPSYGRSDAARNPSIQAYHRFIGELAEREQLGRFVLAGHDLGGLYALTYAVAHPERLRGLVLMNTTIYVHPLVVLGLLPLLAPGFGEAYSWLASRERYRQLVAGEMVAMYPGQTELDTLRALLTPYERYEAWRAIVRSLRGLNPYHVLHWRSRMRELKLPVLILWGAGDPYFPPSTPERLQRDLPSSTLRYLEDAGHFLMLSRPDETAEQLCAFVQSA